MAPRAHQPVVYPTIVKIPDLAALFGISSRQVQDLSSRGILVRGAGQGEYRFLESVHAYTNHLRKQAAGRATEGALSLTDERARLTKIEAEIAARKLEEIEGRVLTLREVEAAWSGFAMQVRAALMSLPSKARSTIPHLTPHDGETLKIMCREILEALSEEVEAGVIGADQRALEDVD